MIQPSSEAADSAGQPWAGRSFTPNPYAADDGRVTPALASALESFQLSGNQAEVISVFGESRLLIPLVAQLGEDGLADSGYGKHEKSQELSIVTVAGPDGRNVLPVFSSAMAMAEWNPLARPVPADGVRTALAAVQDGTELVVLDPGSPTEFVVRRPAVWAIAQNKAAEWQPPQLSTAINNAFKKSISSELAVLDIELSSGDPKSRLDGPELLVTVSLVGGLSVLELERVTTRLAHRWAADEVIATGVDSLTVKLNYAEQD